MNKHSQSDAGEEQIKPGDVWVDPTIDSVVRAGDTDTNDEIVGRTRKTPTRHDGTQRKR
jgi:hypothetical protein